MPINDNGLYVFEDIAFINTSLLTEAAAHYRKFGCYTKAPIGSKDHKDFWDEEERRLREGMTIPGKLIKDARGGIAIQEVHITGTHYGFLNYARIRRKEDDVHGSLAKSLVGKKTINKKFEFPRFLDGQYHYFKAKEYQEEHGLNMIVMKARRKGFSYMESFDSALTANMNPHTTVLVGAFDYKYITLGNQMMGMAKRYLDWFELETDFGRGYLKETVDYIKLGYKKQSEGNKEFGFQSEIIALSFMNNPDAAVGKDAYKIKLEEIGKFPNLQEALDVTLSTVEDGASQTGIINMFGTGGTGEDNWRAAETIFYKPDSRNCIMFDNVWDEGLKGNACGFFYPQSSGYEPFVDEHGNSDKVRAKEDINLKRDQQKKILSADKYGKYLGQRAECPKESFASGSSNIFPAAELNDQLSLVKNDKNYRYLHRAGQLVYDSTGKVQFKTNDQLTQGGTNTTIKVHDPIFTYPLQDGADAMGCYVEWNSPYRDPRTQQIPKGLYRIWHDPYAHDKDTKDIKVRDSLGSFYVYERVNNQTPSRGDKLVAAYVGRPNTTDEYNEVLLKACERWNAEVMFENNRGDVKGYFGRKHKLHLLADEPDLEWEKELKGSKKIAKKGMNMNDARKAKGAMYLRDWLLMPVSTDSFGNAKLNLHYIYDAGLLEELLKWNIKGNFDRVSSLLVGMFDMHECFNKEVEVPPVHDPNDFFNRPLFTN